MEKTEPKLNILLVDDHGPTREEMRTLIDREPDLTVAGEAATGEEAVETARRIKPDVIVMDIALPGITGVEALKIILREFPGTKALALSNHSGRSLVQAILAAGAKGYVRKDRAFEELIPAIRAVIRDEQFLGHHVNE